MKIVIDTNVLVSAFFFGGFPRRILEAVVRGEAAAYATREIVEEYESVVAKMKAGKRGKLPPNLLLPFTARLHIVAPKLDAAVRRDPEYGKFISCAIAANAFYIVDDGKEIPSAGSGRSAKIISAEGFCQLLTLSEVKA